MKPITVLVSGRFNVLHPGHLRLFRFAKECGDRLVVAVENDKLAGNLAHINAQLRLEGVASNSYVDEAILIDLPVVELIKALRPNFVVKGKEHENQDNPEEKAVAEYGGKLLFSSGETTYSSLDLLRRELTSSITGTIQLASAFMNRRKIERARLLEICEKFKTLRVTVIGDLIIDEYITCEPLGMSQEDPSIVVTPIDSVRFVGGAGIVAAHAAGLGAEVDFISVSGLDSARAFALRKLNDFKVSANILEDSSRPTTVKQRYRAKGKSLLRVSHLRQGAISAALQEQMLELVKSVLPKADLIVFSDFNYGVLPQSLVNQVIAIAKTFSVFIVADSQSSSQVGDISRFTGIDLITPTEYEARIYTRNYQDGLVVLAEKLRSQADVKNVLLKLGDEGLLIHAKDATEGSIEGGQIWTDQVPALNLHPKDVAGAGDSLLVVSAMALTCKANIWEAACLGSLAAAIQVGRVGNTPLRIEELTREIAEG